MYLRSLAAVGQMNIFSEIECSSDANAIIRAQEYVQSIFVSTENNYVPSSPSEEAALHAQIVADFDELYKDFRFFYHFWAAHIQKSGKIGDSRLNEIVESQYMYWVRGNRYQIFELEPLKSLLPPHNDVLLELFGVSSAEVIEGLENSGIPFPRDMRMPLWNLAKNLSFLLKPLTQVSALKMHANTPKEELQNRR